MNKFLKWLIFVLFKKWLNLYVTGNTKKTFDVDKLHFGFVIGWTN